MVNRDVNKNEVQTLKPRESDISPICWDTSTAWFIVLNFGVRGNIADVINHAKFHVNRFGGSDTPLLCYSIA